MVGFSLLARPINPYQRIVMTRRALTDSRPCMGVKVKDGASASRLAGLGGSTTGGWGGGSGLRKEDGGDAPGGGSDGRALSSCVAPQWGQETSSVEISLPHPRHWAGLMTLPSSTIT